MPSAHPRRKVYHRGGHYNLRMKTLERLVEKAEGLEVPIWALVFLVIVFSAIRHYLEISFFGYEHVTRLYFLHACSYYLMVFMFIFLALKAITGEKADRIASAISVAVPVILLPPIVDRFIFGRTSGYSYPSPYTWANMAMSFFESDPTYLHRGHQVEFAILLALIFVYILVKMKPLGRVQRIAVALASTFSVYVSIVAISTPRIWPLFDLLSLTGPFNEFTRDYPYIVYNFIYITFASIFFWLTILVENPQKVKILMRDASPPRIIHFSLMYVLGFFVQLNFLGMEDVYFRGNLLVLLIGILSAASGWAFVVAINNYYDRQVDRITNAYRGIVSGEYTEINLMGFSLLALITGAYTALILGIMPLVFYLLFVLLGFLYSYPKIYLKRYGTKTIIIGLGSALLFAMGYFSPWYPEMRTFDLRFWTYFLVLFAVFSAGSVMNDLKDVESDVENGVKTIFTVFGRERGKKIAAAMMLLAFSLPGIIAPEMLPVFVLLAALGAFLLMREKVLYIYLVYFAEYFTILLFHTL